MPKDRKKERARRKQLYEQLRLQAEILCDSHNDDGRATVVLHRMMSVILDIIGHRKLNDVARKTLANHFADCAYDRSAPDPAVELGGAYERNALRLSGTFDIGDLAKRIIWTETRKDTIG